MKTYTAYIQWNTKTHWYAGFIPGIPGAEAQGYSMAELEENLREVLAQCLKERKKSRQSARGRPRSPGFHQLDITV